LELREFLKTEEKGKRCKIREWNRTCTGKKEPLGREKNSRESSLKELEQAFAENSREKRHGRPAQRWYQEFRPSGGSHLLVTNQRRKVLKTDW